ncbi:MAG: undecaprenyl-diphosphate phosphatase, partial [Clostridia bacterium]|nr:undecaprenyl-diphosphate phosphatase [Clostridia bacterium]
LLLLALVPTVILALLFKKISPFDRFYEAAENGRFLGFCFLITTLLLLLSDRVRRPQKQQRRMKDMRVSDALIIGGLQGVGVLPGVSRSGSTISGALFAGLSRKAAADFSFLLSIPSIIGGAVLEIPDALSEGIGDIHITCVVAGMIVAGVTGYFAIKLVLGAIKRKKLWGFAVYTGVLGLLVLADQFVTHIFF